MIAVAVALLAAGLIAWLLRPAPRARGVEEHDAVALEAA